MSTIKVDTLQTRAGSTAAVTGAGFVATDQIRGNTSANSVTVVAEGGTNTTNLQQGLAKVWCSGASDGASIQDSFNVSSMADTATGVQTPSIANDMVNNDYSVFSCCNNDTLICPNVKGIGTGVYSAKMQAPDGTDTDVVMASTVHGDLA